MAMGHSHFGLIAALPYTRKIDFSHTTCNKPILAAVPEMAYVDNDY